MDLKNFYSITKPIYFILIAFVISSCGTYQYSGNVNDGIYNSNISSENAVVVETKEVNNKANNDYYKSAFRISEYEAFKILIKLIYVEGKSEYRTSLQKQNQHYRFQLFRRLRGILFSYLPFKFAYYTYTRIVSIYFHLNNELY